MEVREKVVPIYLSAIIVLTKIL